ncbi:MAG TPA: adenylate/guanylate cyclase domain-containing protein [Alphaproteobacteria bacterium]|nr:adenylate/guanylate cyclase domain-containing protein [Alphaproteobacteria bacterium]
MSESELESGPSTIGVDANDDGWPVWPTIDWVLSKGRMIPGLDDLVDGLALSMVQNGAPLSRLRLSMRTLHPLIAARTAIWTKNAEAPKRIESTHGLEQRPTHAGSPLAEIGSTRRPFRRNLQDGLTSDDHRVLHELAAEGATDYFGLPLEFSSGQAAILVFVTNKTGGFGDGDLRKFHALASVLAPVVEVQGARDVALALADTYIGPRTGRRVLDGQITRGDIEQVQAAIWFSDIRGWTELNNTQPAEVVVDQANRYFDMVAAAVEANGGEVLKFIGDGVLAIFPTQDPGDERTVCQNALESARQALRMNDQDTGPIDLSFGIGLHFGDVLYGNVGSQKRLDFTVFGPAVNLAARVESECANLGETLLFTRAFAERISDTAVIVANQSLKGFDGPREILTLDET